MSSTEPELSFEQKVVVDAVTTGKGGHRITTVSGKAGAGKSVVARAIMRDGNWIVLSPTGLAAKNIGGVTIHKFLGLRAKEPTHLVQKNLNRVNANVLRCCDGVIVDEKSMVRADLLDAMDRIFRITCRTGEPFAGKSIVLIGDAFQIPPVVDPEKDSELFGMDGTYKSPWFFDSRVMSEFGSAGYELTHVFRQQGDPAFRDALNALQVGDSSHLHVFNRRVGKAKKGQLVLTFTNARADAINRMALEQLPGESKTIKAWWDNVNSWQYPSPEVLEVKKGARVMTTANGDGFVNGDQGNVVGWTDSTVTVELDSGEEITLEKNRWEEREYTVGPKGEIAETPTGVFCQIPLRLAYAITTHKSQGQTFDGGHILMDRKPWDHGMLYVALSRFRNLDGLTIRRPVTPEDVVIDGRVLEWYRKLQRVKPVGST